MTCTFCGSTLDGTESECPFCGHKIIQEANEEPVTPKKSKSAFDFSSKFSAASDNEYSDYEEPAPKRSNKTSFNNDKLTTVFAIGLGAILLMSLISLILCIGISNKVADLNQDMLSQMYQLQTAQNELANSVNSVSSTVGNIGTTIEQSNLSRFITITKQPTEVTTWVGRGAPNTEGETVNQLLFSIEASGNNLTYEWQKFDQTSGSWVTIQFDPDNNDAYGLHVYNLPDGSGSQLCARGLTSLAFGSYKCVVSDSTGIQESDVVTITERDKP